MFQGGDKRLNSDKSTVTVGSEVVVSGPPGETVFYKPDGQAGAGKTVTLGADGKAKITAPSQPGAVTVVLVSDPTKFLSIRVIDL